MSELELENWWPLRAVEAAFATGARPSRRLRLTFLRGFQLWSHAHSQK